MTDEKQPSADQVGELKKHLSAEQGRSVDRALGTRVFADPKYDETGKVAGVAPPEHIMQFFAHAHLPPALAAVSKPFGDQAEHLVATLPRNPERTVALRKLLESKDAAVRAFIAK